MARSILFDGATPNAIGRRAFLSRSMSGLGSIALASLLGPSAGRGAGIPTTATAPATDHWAGVVRPLHFPAKAKRVIYLYMSGGPSHLETFDNKPKLLELAGQKMPESVTKNQPIAQLQNQELKILQPQFAFKKYGKSGQEFSDLFKHMPQLADDICIIRSMTAEAINHDPAHTFMNTGSTISGRPSMGSWVIYGLGSPCENLPGFVVLSSVGGGQNQPIAARQWHSGFLPSRFQGVEFYSKGDPVLYVKNPPGVNAAAQRDVVDAAAALNRIHNKAVDDPELATRISQYEMAFRMQSSVPELMDISNEPKEILEMYGTKGADGSFGANCLLARRLAERGVRFIQLYHRDWDHHGDIKNGIQVTANLIDQGTTALVKDLKQRGMLEDTLVIWGGEFGRTPMAQGSGRDHHIKGFSMWMAGAGIQPGITYGATDDLGYHAEVDPVEVHDLHATILHQLGIDHKRLTYPSQGRDFRLTDVRGQVIQKILS